VSSPGRGSAMTRFTLAFARGTVHAGGMRPNRVMLPAARSSRHPVPRPDPGTAVDALPRRLRTLTGAGPAIAQSLPPERPSTRQLARREAEEAVGGWTPPADVEPVTPGVPAPVELDEI